MKSRKMYRGQGSKLCLPWLLVESLSRSNIQPQIVEPGVEQRMKLIVPLSSCSLNTIATPSWCTSSPLVLQTISTLDHKWIYANVPIPLLGSTAKLVSESWKVHCDERKRDFQNKIVQGADLHWACLEARCSCKINAATWTIIAAARIAAIELATPLFWCSMNRLGNKQISALVNARDHVQTTNHWSNCVRNHIAWKLRKRKTSSKDSHMFACHRVLDASWWWLQK